MIYSEFPLPPTARNAAFCAWRFALERGDPELVGHSIPPDGTTNLVLVRAPDGGIQAQLAGPSLTARTERVAREWTYVGLRLRPEAALAILGRVPPVAASEALALDGPLAPIFADLAALAQYEDGLGGAPGIAEAFAGIAGPDRSVASAVDRLVRSGGRASLAALAAEANVGPRHFRRRFRAATGVSPKQYASIQRVRHALILSLTEASWADVAAEAGYSDQPHLARAVQQRFGAAPGRVAGYLGGMRHELLAPCQVRFVQDAVAAGR